MNLHDISISLRNLQSLIEDVNGLSECLQNASIIDLRKLLEETARTMEMVSCLGQTIGFTMQESSRVQDPKVPHQRLEPSQAILLMRAQTCFGHFARVTKDGLDRHKLKDCVLCIAMQPCVLVTQMVFGRKFLDNINLQDWWKEGGNAEE